MNHKNGQNMLKIIKVQISLFVHVLLQANFIWNIKMFLFRQHIVYKSDKCSMRKEWSGGNKWQVVIIDNNFV